MQLPLDLKRSHIIVISLGVVCLIAIFSALLRPVGQTQNFDLVAPHSFVVQSGESFWNIAGHLKNERLIRSVFAFTALAGITGNLDELKPGAYKFDSRWSSLSILKALAIGAEQELEVVIPPGSSIYEVDKILSYNQIISPGDLINLSNAHGLEGRLFPDTYRFFTHSSPDLVVQKMLDNFEFKAAPLLRKDPKNIENNLILASLLEKEVPNPGEARIVAGVINKRLRSGMPLQIDATICYLKRQKQGQEFKNCYPLTPLDFKINSTYNTYLHTGWPPGPISSPGLAAIQAAMAPQASSYWYYLSDPVSKKTVFAQTLEEHNENRFKYLNIY